MSRQASPVPFVRKTEHMTCTQPLLIHADGTGTCAVPGCLDRDTLAEAVRRHRYVVNCQAVLGTRCAVCHGLGSFGREAKPPADVVPTTDTSMCPGVAVVHVDLSLECSEPGCQTNAPSRSAWLARHADVRSCSNLPTPCPLCAMSDDRT
jgi:hypothetical protein